MWDWEGTGDASITEYAVALCTVEGGGFVMRQSHLTTDLSQAKKTYSAYRRQVIGTRSPWLYSYAVGAYSITSGKMLAWASYANGKLVRSWGWL